MTSPPPTRAALRLRGRLTRRGAAATSLGAALLVAGTVLGYPGLLVLGLGLLVMAAGSLALVGWPRAVDVSRVIVPLEVARNAACAVTVTIVDRGRWSRIQLEAADQVDGQPIPARPLRATAGGSARTHYELPTGRRGVLRVGPLTLRRSTPAGLAAGVARAELPAEVRVLPRVLPVRGLPTGQRHGNATAEDRVAAGGTSLVNLREYVPGDDLRWVHWATSARTGRLMVREDAEPSRAHLTLLLDDRLASYASAEDFEEAVDVCASLAWAASEQGHPVAVRTCSGGLADFDGGAPREIVAMLAGVEGTPGGPVLADVATGTDVAAVATGPHADVRALESLAQPAAVRAILVVDPGSGTAFTGGSTLRGARAEDLIGLWDHVVAGPVGAGR